ncbi:MAG: glycoside hydrolase family 88 protein [Ignavibacteriales bacterium]|nr:glycoside hydrolase family 88 protein [Ignavibacteriales bacterium]
MNKTHLGILIPLLLLAPLPCGGSGNTQPAKTDVVASPFPDSIQIPASWPWSKRIAESFVLRHAGAVTYDSLSPNQRWNYEQGLMLVALRSMWLHSKDQRYFDFIKGNLDQFVEESGSIKTYKYEDFNIDNIAVGRALLTVYEATKEQKYKSAADTLRKQLQNQPRANEGGFWHKQIYPYQMWLDGLFMGEPFYAWYAVMTKEPRDYDDIVNQFVFIYKHTRDPKTGLLYHGWDESKQQRWADPKTGCSPHFWGRAIGWYAMALVDVLDILPKDYPRRKELLPILRDVSAALLKFQDKKTHLWYQVLDQGTREGNYLEASASGMFAYAFARGANKGYLPKTYMRSAKETFKGIVDNLVSVKANGFVDLLHTCQGAGLGGKPYRDGSYEYYVGEAQRVNDMKGYGPFLLASIEIERAAGTTRSARK